MLEWLLKQLKSLRRNKNAQDFIKKILKKNIKEMCDKTLQNMTKKLQKFGAHAPKSSIRYLKKRP